MDVDADVPRERARAVWGAPLPYLAAIGVLFVNSSPTDRFQTWQLILLTVLLPLVIAAVLLRVRMPYALPLLGLVAISASTFSVFMVGIMSLAVRRTGVLVWLIGAAGAAGAAAVILRRDLAAGAGPGGLAVGAVLTVLLAAAAPALVGGYIRTHRRLAASVAERAIRADYDRELAAQRAVHAERERIAQEMHDSLGHALALIAMQAGALQVGTPDTGTQAAAEQIRESARSGLSELRSVVHALGEDARRDPAPGLGAVPALVAASRAAGAVVRLSDELPVDPVPPSSIGRVVHQAVQEALTNAHRHAPGAPVDIVLAGSPGPGVQITVSNSLAPGGERGAGTGLARLRSRVEVLGGELDARARHGRFELRIRLPWEGDT